MVYWKTVFIFPLHPKIDLLFRIYKVEREQAKLTAFFLFYFNFVLSIFIWEMDIIYVGHVYRINLYKKKKIS